MNLPDIGVEILKWKKQEAATLAKQIETEARWHFYEDETLKIQIFLEETEVIY